MNFKAYCKESEELIKSSYEDGVTMEQAERYAGRFLYAQMLVSAELKKADLDARMKKSGMKTLCAAAYSESIEGKEKKPTEAQLGHLINTNEHVVVQQDFLDKAEVELADLTRYYNIFKEAHIYYRGISKGKFE